MSDLICKRCGGPEEKTAQMGWVAWSCATCKRAVIYVTDRTIWQRFLGEFAVSQPERVNPHAPRKGYPLKRGKAFNTHA